MQFCYSNFHLNLIACAIYLGVIPEPQPTGGSRQLKTQLAAGSRQKESTEC